MAVVQTVVHDNLLALKVGVTERRCNVNDCARLVALALLCVDKALQVRQRKCEERALHGADQHRAIAINIAARIKGHQDQLLRLEPFHGLAAQIGKGIAVNIGKTLFIGRLIVRDTHTVRLAAAHIILHEVDRRAVLASCYVRFLDRTFAGHVEHDVIYIGMIRAEHHVVQLRLAGRNRHAFTVFEHILQLVRESEFVEQRVHLFVSSFHTASALPKAAYRCACCKASSSLMQSGQLLFIYSILQNRVSRQQIFAFLQVIIQLLAKCTKLPVAFRCFSHTDACPPCIILKNAR